MVSRSLRARAACGVSGSSSIPAFAAQRPHDVAEGRVFDALYEGDRVAAGTAAEALEKPAVRMDVQRRRLLGMKRAEPDEVVSALAQSDVLSDQARDVGASADFAQCVLVVSHR